MHQLLLAQYELIKSARHALFTYCRSMNQGDLVKKINTFNDKSIIDMLVHNVNTYISWIKNFGLDATSSFHEGEDIKGLDDIEQLFTEVDLFVTDFLNKYSSDYLQSFTKTIAHKGITFTTTPLQLFTHVTTHEFHHKGQILTMSRISGYTPADTDVIRS